MNQTTHTMSSSSRALALALLCGALVALASLVVARPALAAEACPNERLREESNLNPETERPYSIGLPDCRALELVSPSFKNLSSIRGERFASDGSAYVALAIGSFSGGSNSNSPDGNVYEFARTSSGWQTTPLQPPPSQYFYTGNVNPAEANTDTGGALVSLRSRGPHSAWADLYRREPDGSFTDMGPLYPPLPPTGIPSLEEENGHIATIGGVRFAGSSADLSHVVVENINPPLWPGESTKSYSLYEYVGTDSSEPTLVGVSNESSAPWLNGAEHLNEGASMISQCGTRLGGSSALDHNAVSASGETIFFTALGRSEICSGFGSPKVNEVYARVAGEKTLDISSPSPAEYPVSQGKGPDPEECSGACLAASHAAAEYQGASTDGSRVFFTTAQPLLNEDTDSSVDLYMAQIEGQGPAAHLSELRQLSHGSNPAEVQGLASISEDGSHAYFVAHGVLTDAANEYGVTAQPGQDNLYACDTQTGQLSFIAVLSSQDKAQWESTGPSSMQTTGDGRYLLFTSHANPTPDAAGRANQVYRYDYASGQLTRVSVGADGLAENGNAAGEAVVPGSSRSDVTNSDSHPAISEDGTTVFESRGALTPNAVVGHANAYEYQEGQVYLLASQPNPVEPSERPPLGSGGETGIDPSGRDIFLYSEKSLVPADTNTGADLYDARVEGGFPAPLAPPVCYGDPCQGQASAFSSAGSASLTSTFSGAEEGPAHPRTFKHARHSPKRHRGAHKGKAHKKAIKHQGGH